MTEEFEIKLASIEDMKDVFDLSNDDAVRQNSFNQEKIEWESHQNWFKKKLEDENCIFYIIKKNAAMLAQVRLETSGSNEYDISISVSKSFRGKGFGTKILSSISKKFLKDRNPKQINAFIKSDNMGSIKMFESAGYILKETYAEKVRYVFE